jgi:release factor glutamine methyltransferase
MTVVATDVSVEALAIARRNAVRHGVATRVHLVRGDLLTAFARRPLADLIVSNPPYVPDESPDVAADVRACEPPGALFSGPEGLDHIERLVATALAVVRPGGHLMFELGSGQAEAVRALLLACGWLDVELWPDLQDIPRVAVGYRR